MTAQLFCALVFFYTNTCNIFPHDEKTLILFSQGLGLMSRRVSDLMSATKMILDYFKLAGTRLLFRTIYSINENIHSNVIGHLSAFLSILIIDTDLPICMHVNRTTN